LCLDFFIKLAYVQTVSIPTVRNDNNGIMIRVVDRFRTIPRDSAQFLAVSYSSVNPRDSSQLVTQLAVAHSRGCCAEIFL